MNKQLEIIGIDYLNPNFKGYGAILTDHNPEIIFQDPKHIRPIESYLWYPIELGQIPNTFTSYFREKLGVTDPVESQQMISDWNTKPLLTAAIQKQLKIGKKRFIMVSDPMGSVLTNYSDRPKNYKTVHAGSGGYIWQYLKVCQLSDTHTTHMMLLNRFGLRLKSERDRFIRSWQRVNSLS